MKLSILIPAKNEPYLQKTVEDLKTKIKADTEILWREDYGIGQRALTNELAREAKGYYVMKLDAHCSLSNGFDIALLNKIKELGDNTILAPLLMPLDAQTWTVNGKKQMAQFVFDTNLVMQHAIGDVGETMCLQGSAWLMSKENYFKWSICDESLGSWGGQAVELGIKAFLNGGKCITTRDAYYGHVFRHTDADFPYDRGKDPGKFANTELKKRYLNKSIEPLVRKFMPCADWTEDKISELLR